MSTPTNTSEQKFVSPNDIFKSSKGFFLDGREPKTDHDWTLLVNFWAYNIAFAEVEACKIMKRIFNCPLSDEMVAKIAKYQIANKAREKANGTQAK